MNSNAFGIDLGTNHIKIYSRATDSVYVQKNMIAIKEPGELFAYGDSAFDMYEKTPYNIRISYPLSYGVISDLGNMETVIRYMIADLQGGNLKSADFLIAVPCDVTDVEKRAFYDLLKEAGVKAHKILAVDKAVADGIGMGIDVTTSQGTFVVNVGFETTEISILSLGGIVLSRLIKVGGQKFDEAIRNAVRSEYGLLIGGKTSESVKNSLLDLELDGRGAVVFGRDIVTGLPVEREIPTKLIVESMGVHFRNIIDNIKLILEKAPPELSADIYRNGIYLTGGASQVSHLVEDIANGTGLKVNISNDPITTTVEGLSRIMRESTFSRIPYPVEGMSK